MKNNHTNSNTISITNSNRKNLRQLFVPICLETLLYMLAGMVDTLMLSTVSDEAVGAVGTSNTYIGMFIIMFSVVSTGMIAVMTQNIGANRQGVAYQALQIGVICNTVFGVCLSLFLFFFSESILEIVGIAEGLKASAKIYLKIVGGSCFFNALIPVFAGYLRSFGFTKQSLFATIIANIMNVVLNAVFLIQFHMGVRGVAIATAISKGVNLLLVVVLAQLLVKAKQDHSRVQYKTILGQILKVGLPSAMENVLYNVAMTLMIRFLNQMDAEGINVTARAYTTQVTCFSFCVGAALAQANAIMTGWRIGGKEYDECDRGTKKAAIIGIGVTIVFATTLAILGPYIMRFFTEDPVMVKLTCTLLLIDIVLEIGRVTNLVFGQALKTSGDAVFPVIIGAVFMFLCAVGGTYLFGIRLGLMVVGAYIGLASDECLRAVFMFARWQTGKWRAMGLVKQDN